MHAGRFICRLRIMSCCRKSAFSARSSCAGYFAYPFQNWDGNINTCNLTSMYMR
jgi:hypothetical protein